MSEEAASLKRKFEELEEEVKRLREPLESTLMDVRELVSSLENPFNYATSMLSLGEPGGKAGSRERRGDASEADEAASRDLGQELSGDLPRPDLGKHPSGGRNLPILLCAYLLLKILGRERALSFLGSRYARRLAPITLLELLNDSIELLSCYESVDKFPAENRPAFKEDLMFTAMYLVHSLASGADERFFTSLTLAIKMLEAGLGSGR